MRFSLSSKIKRSYQKTRVYLILLLEGVVTIYFSIANYRIFPNLFDSHLDLNSEYAKAKKCANDLLASECTVSSQTKIVLSLALSDYNPFCANNRDPGATGNDQCSRFLLASKSDGISMK